MALHDIVETKRGPSPPPENEDDASWRDDDLDDAGWYELNEVRDDIPCARYVPCVNHHSRLVGDARAADGYTHHDARLEDTASANQRGSDNKEPDDVSSIIAEPDTTADNYERIERLSNGGHTRYYHFAESTLFIATGNARKYQTFVGVADAAGMRAEQVEISPDHEIQAGPNECLKVCTAKAGHAYTAFTRSKMYRPTAQQWLLVEDTALGFCHLDGWPGINIKHTARADYKLLRTLVPRGGPCVQTICIAIIDVTRGIFAARSCADRGVWSWHTTATGYGYDPYVSIKGRCLADQATNPTRDSAAAFAASVLTKPSSYEWTPIPEPASAHRVPVHHDAL